MHEVTRLAIHLVTWSLSHMVTRHLNSKAGLAVFA